ncbi:PIG-L deacetylase family protein [Paenibacillus massiliensis]|uniref:PIG-L deacetylase family protein n=1 Tax=Paenibacillus massiliensis TaxID=225917 RepID=UPI0004721542|nr:PIG-L family deacetylase [Paenibacillus massiliensis]
MSKNIVVIAPHPDDETLGCGGTLLKHAEAGDNIYWLIVTTLGDSYSQEIKNTRAEELVQVAKMYPFDKVFELGFETTTLDQISGGILIEKIGKVFQKIKPNIVYAPYPGDIHSDHKAVFDATMACTKWFRYPYVERVLIYETLSETDFTIDPDSNGFRPNVFVNIEPYLAKKIELMRIFKSEISEFPFPRSEKSITSLAHIRGATGGFEAAEAFMLLKEKVL